MAIPPAINRTTEQKTGPICCHFYLFQSISYVSSCSHRWFKKTVNNSDTKFRGVRAQKHKRPVSYISLYVRCLKITALGSTCGTAMRWYILTSCRARCSLSYVSILCIEETPALDPAGCLCVLQSTHHYCQLQSTHHYCQLQSTHHYCQLQRTHHYCQSIVTTQRQMDLHRWLLVTDW